MRAASAPTPGGATVEAHGAPQSIVIAGPSQDAAEFAGGGTRTVAAEFEHAPDRFVRIGSQCSRDRLFAYASEPMAVFVDVSTQSFDLVDAGHCTVSHFIQCVIERGSLADRHVARAFGKATIEVDAASVNSGVNDLEMSQ